MYLEVKAVLSGISMVCIAAAMVMMIPYSIFFAFLLIIAIGLFLMGDMIIGYFITRNRLKPQLDPTPPGCEPCILLTIAGGFDVINTVKKPHGKREFRYNGHNATVVNKGDYPIRFPNGNIGFIAHESCDTNINMYEAKYAEIMNNIFGTNNLKEIYSKVKEFERSKREESV